MDAKPLMSLDSYFKWKERETEGKQGITYLL